VKIATIINFPNITSKSYTIAVFVIINVKDFPNRSCGFAYVPSPDKTPIVHYLSPSNQKENTEFKPLSCCCFTFYQNVL